jgi:hypothetical protein
MGLFNLTRLTTGVLFFLKEFSAISKEREEDIQKREMLKHCYSVVENCLGEMDENLTSMLNTLYINPDVQEINPDVREILNERKERLERKDYNLLVAGNFVSCIFSI